MEKATEHLPAALAGSLSVSHSSPLPFKDVEKSLRAFEVVAEFPKLTFLENLVLTDDGSVVFTSHEEGRVYILREGSEATVLATISGKTTGIASLDGDGYIVSAFAADRSAAVFVIDNQGRTSGEFKLPDATFLNGIAPAGNGNYLIADSYKGVIWMFNIADGKARVWLDDPALKRLSEMNPAPAANGVKIFGPHVYVTNTQAKTLLRFALKNGVPVGAVELVKSNVLLDDFALDSRGTVYAATHTFNSLVRIDPDGRMAILADLSSGMAGSTAVALDEARGLLYVTTNGGMLRPPEGGLQTGKLVRIYLHRSATH